MLFYLAYIPFYTFSEGVLEELNKKEDEQLRKEILRQNSTLKSAVVNSNQAPLQIVPQNTLNNSQKDYTELQREQVLKQELFDLMVKEESSMEGYN